MPMNEQPKWYILHTYSGYEAMVKDSLEKLILNNNLQDYIVDVKIPMEQVVEEKNGKLKVVERKLLPCYVFIKMIYAYYSFCITPLAHRNDICPVCGLFTYRCQIEPSSKVKVLSTNLCQRS